MTTVHFNEDRLGLEASGAFESFGVNAGLTTITYFAGRAAWPDSDISGVTPTADSSAHSRRKAGAEYELGKLAMLGCFAFSVWADGAFSF